MEVLNATNETSSETNNVSDVVDNVTSGSELPLNLRVPTWCHTLSQIFVCGLIIVGCLGNTLLLAVFKRDKKRSSTTIYIIWLVVANLVALLFNGPVDILFFTSEWSSIASVWICRFYAYSQHNVFLNSAILIFCIGLDRYLKVYRPHSAHKLKQISTKLCPLIFGISGLILIPVFTIVYQDQWSQCQIDRDSNTVVEVADMVLSFVVIGSFIPLCFFYVKIALFIREKSKVRNIPNTRGDSDSTHRLPGKTEKAQQTAGQNSSYRGKRLVDQENHVSINTSKQVQTKTKSNCLRPTSLSLTPLTGQSKIMSRKSVEETSTIGGQTSTMTPVESVEKACSITTSPDTGEKFTVASLRVADVVQENNVTASPGSGKHEPPLCDKTQTKKPPTTGRQGEQGPAIMTPSTSGQQLGSVEEPRPANQVRRTTITMALITAFFFLTSVFPVIVIHFISTNVETSLGVDILMFFSYRLPFLNYASNAILYTVSSTEFRQKVKKLFQDIRADIQQRF